MHNCIILGSGRSGTSMAAGTLARGGYFMGDRLHPPRDSNPKGFFEDAEVNQINEELLKQVVPTRLPILGRFFRRDQPAQSERWVARVRVGTRIPVPKGIPDRIRRLTAQTPYCFKDPRFCYTLPVWRPFLNDVAFICVFRDPLSTAASILRECHTHLRGLHIDRRRAVEVWTLMYRHILEVHRHAGQWNFFHFNQLLSDDGLDRLEAATGAEVDRSFPEPALRRSRSTGELPDGAERLYRQLCDLSGYSEAGE